MSSLVLAHPVLENTALENTALENTALENARKSLEKLAKEVRAIETSGRATYSSKVISSGCDAVDRLLPGGGYAAGSMIEFLQDRAGSGAMALGLTTAKQAIEPGKYLLVVDRHRRFYPPAAIALGLPIDRMVVVHPDSVADAVWAIDQALRSSGVGAVLAELDTLDDRSARRLQLAAEQGGGLGIWIRNAKLMRGPSWAEVQWLIRSQASSTTSLENTAAGNHRRMQLRLLRCRGGKAGKSISLVLNGDGAGSNWIVEDSAQVSPSQVEGNRYATQSSLYLAAELAMPASDPRGSGTDRAAIRSASA